MIGIGMSSGVSLVAYPNIMPWSPAPTESNGSALPARMSWDSVTPRAMSGDCRSSAVITPTALPSKPKSPVS